LRPYSFSDFVTVHADCSVTYLLNLFASSAPGATSAAYVVALFRVAVGCPAMTYYDVSTGHCVPCPADHYQPLQAQLYCVPCQGHGKVTSPAAAAACQGTRLAVEPAQNWQKQSIAILSLNSITK